MKFISTRDTNNLNKFDSAFVIKKGIADDGGLFVPESFPVITADDIKALCAKNYVERAADILGLFLTDYTAEELKGAASAAYSKEAFEDGATVISKVGDNEILELWHGPTSAFKDMALQIMPRLLSTAIEKCGETRDALILVATSGDTGKAALEGYADVDRVRILVFYPSEGVSRIQKLQMQTQKGNNVKVAAIRGNFDDAQSGVKRIFTSADVAEKLDQKGLFFSSANSINWGRLAPQIVYYISAYCDLVNEGEINLGDELNITVPTGNFGNILAAYIAKKMGLPVGKLICASNKNNILTDFFTTGVYDKRRVFYATISPSMDILISSNLERLLYFATDAEVCAGFMKDLSENGIFTVNEDLRAKFEEDFAAYCCDESLTKETIKKYFDSYSYLCDPHTAVGIYAADKYKEETGDKRAMLIASTASPYKFSAAVLEALGESVPEDDFEALRKLSEKTGTVPPKNLSSLADAVVRFDKIIDVKEMAPEVEDFAAL